jgi:hypothetical protein
MVSSFHCKYKILYNYLDAKHLQFIVIIVVKNMSVNWKEFICILVGEDAMELLSSIKET